MNATFKAISDPSRRKILKILRQGDMTAGEIAQHFDISKPSVSHHLGILKQAELVESERKGQFIIYSLNTTVFQELMSWLHDLFDLHEKRGSENNE